MGLVRGPSRVFSTAMPTVAGRYLALRAIFARGAATGASQQQKESVLLKSKLRVLSVLAVTAGMLTGGTAVASAAPAVFNGSGATTWVATPTPLKVRYQFQASNVTLTCNGSPGIYNGGTVGNSGTPSQGFLDGFNFLGNCSGGSGGFVRIDPLTQLRAVNNGTGFSLTSSQSLNVYISALGTGTLSGANVPFTVPWTNPVGAASGKVTYSDTLVGKTNTGYSVYLTGTLNVIGGGMGSALALS